MQKQISPAVGVVIIVVIAVAAVAFVWTRSSSSSLGVPEQKFQDWKQKMQASTPAPRTRLAGQPSPGSGMLPPKPAGAGGR